ncbi:MAG TPA: hypothetical protein VFU69_00395, partial [Ktedonobacterales bacterium]|nr:hypothetical protein [Ktedonobacterales bacterium]
MSPSKPPSDHHPAPRRSGKRRLIVIAAALAILALIAGGTAYALLGRASATVTITPTSTMVSNIYTLSAVTGTPDASRQQVGARLISTTTPAETKTVKASGSLSLPATQAKGTLILRNWDAAPKTFAAGTVLPDWSADEVVNCGDSPEDIVLDATVTVPAAGGSAAGYGVAHAPGHVLQPGASGNIPGFTGDKGCVYFLWAEGKCDPGYFHHCWTIAPADKFTGGQDTYDGPAVQQSDIDNAANSLISAHQPDAQHVLQPQMRANERLMNTPYCTRHVSTNHQAGDHAAQVTVSVAFTCTGAVYDQQAALALITPKLSAQAAANPGAGYALAGQIQLAIVDAAPGNQGAMILTINAAGIWAYHFTDAQKQHLATLLIGKSAQETVLSIEQPSGLGWRPDGSLLAVSMTGHEVWRRGPDGEPV